jgi:hypothetical protein
VIPLPVPDETPDPEPHQLVAAAVIRQAVFDALSTSARVSTPARTFLSNSHELRTWCHLAGLRPETVLRGVLRSLNGGPIRWRPFGVSR